ncbi:RNA 3'-terminal phosphate cyclase [Nibea albiflora]|uniref:RNA 3'-terminal phosphate cyclase n=1 Tax=Nibea albiflora TaxID=240163 RepID=A0ACB7ENB7_NIBAL|nr:RNA 3'-terminal phosphate cyclase [Nibea albiflora]
MDSAAVEIDGSVMEGGGQILRVSAALSCIHRLRHQDHEDPSRQEHTGLSLQGATIGSTDISLTPGKIRSGNHTADTQTAGGYYPKGGGEVVVTVNPVKELQPVIMMERGNITKIYGRAFVAGVLPFKLAKDMSTAAVRTIRKEIKELYINIQPLQEKEKACGNGNGIIIIAESSTGCVFAGSALGKKGVYADKIGIEAAEMLLRNIRHNGCVDEFLQDQLIIFMALAKGTSRIRTGAVTLHTQTAIHIAEQLTQAKFTITKSEDELSSNVNYIIECEGSGASNPHL